jgi:aspartyl-tRNA(Asn)/glutamyl-tRNA(Gln) amidotransferase subunit C
VFRGQRPMHIQQPVRRGSAAVRAAGIPRFLGFSPATMNLSLSDVYRIAHLARLEIDAAHAEDVRAKLASIFGLIDELIAIDTTGVEPMAHAQDATLPLRDDVVAEADLSEHYQALAPAADDGLYLVPKVIE